LEIVASDTSPMKADSPDWTDGLAAEFGSFYEGRTALVTGADGFMGSHLTDALVALGADVHAFVRATSSGALNNISHQRDKLRVHFADLTDKTSVDYLVKELRDSVSDRPYLFHLGAQAHVGESWHRPYETVVANTIGTLNLLQSIVDHGLELEKFDTAGTSEEYGNVREAVAHHHTYDDEGSLVLHERSPINPKSIYATSKVAADFLTMNYHDAFGVPGDRNDRHAGPGTRHDRARAARSAARLLLLHRRRPRPSDGRCARHPRRRLRLRAGQEHLDGRLGEAHPRGRRAARLLAGRPRSRLDRRALPARR
jgi:nucleoside-diphosphate-sugar epimerase